MPGRATHVQFDRHLADRHRHVLLEDGAYAKVHEFMDRGVKAYGAGHRMWDPFTAPKVCGAG